MTQIVTETGDPHILPVLAGNLQIGLISMQTINELATKMGNPKRMLKPIMAG